MLRRTIHVMGKMETVTPPPPAKRRALQDAFLGAVVAQRVQVTAHLRNGVKLEGRIVGFDAYQILIEGRGVTQALYKSALSTVLAHGVLNLHEDGGPPGDRGDGVATSRNRAARSKPMHQPARPNAPAKRAR